MTHIYRWTTTRYGPLADRLQGRLNEQCRVITRGKCGDLDEWPEDLRVREMPV